jgi:acid phosphatase (class A)
VSRSGPVGVFGAAGLLMVLVACAPTENRAPKLTEVSTGYLTAGDLARLADAVPPPPLPASEADLADKATSHAELRPPLALQHFDCALGVRFGSAETPNLDRVMARVFHDAESVAEQVKRRAARPRPVGDDPQRRACQVVSEAGRKSASHPSGSAAVGAAYGEAFAAIDPSRAEAVRRIGHEIGVSRLVCAMHYPSDVATGEAIGRAAAAQAVATQAFQTDLAAARAELAAVRAKGLTNPGCAAERAVLPTVLP